MEYLRRKLCLLAGSILLTCAAWGQTLPTDSITKDPEAWYIHFKTGKAISIWIITATEVLYNDVSTEYKRL